MDGASAVTARSSVMPSSVRIAEKTFEICAADDQARAVLQTVNQVSGQLSHAKALRRQKSLAFTPFEKRMLDETFQGTENAIHQIAGLTERARADMPVYSGTGKVNTRLIYVLRDSPNVQVSLTKLSVAHQNLSMALFMMMNRDCRPPAVREKDHKLYPDPAVTATTRTPLIYEDTSFIAEKRLKNKQRRASAQTLDAKTLGIRSHSSSSLSTMAYLPSKEMAELEGTEPERLPAKLSTNLIPTISVSKSDTKVDNRHSLLFQDATSFMPPARGEVWPPPLSVPNTAARTDNTSSPDFQPHKQPRPKSWSSSTPAQENRRPSTATLRSTVEAQCDDDVSDPELHFTAEPERQSNSGAPARDFRRPSNATMRKTIEAQCDDDASDTELDLTGREEHRSKGSAPARDERRPSTATLRNTIEAQCDDFADLHLDYLPERERRSSNVSLYGSEKGQVPTRALPYPTETPTDRITFPNVVPMPEQRGRSWSSSTRLQADELSLNSPPADAQPSYSRSTYPPPRLDHFHTPPYPNSPLPQGHEPGKDEQTRQQANERYIDWYSPASFSSHFRASTTPTQLSPQPQQMSPPHISPLDRKGRRGQWFPPRYP